MNFKNWKASLLLSIIIPMSLLATFRITGVLQGPIVVSEVETLETIMWETERPDEVISLDNSVNSTYEGEIKLFQEIFVGHYVDVAGKYGGSDYIMLCINITASTLNGYMQNIRLTLRDQYEKAQLHIPEDKINPAKYDNPPSKYIKNLTVTDYEHWAREVFADLAGINSPKTASFWISADWILQSSYNQTHVMEAIFETIYFNGTSYKKIVQPFQITIKSDANDSLDTAETIEQGTTYLLYLGGRDKEDYYKIHVDEGYTISINANTTSRPHVAHFSLDLYNPQNKWAVGSSTNYVHSLSFTANSAGEWLIRVHLDLNGGFYSLTINLYSPEGS